MNKYWTVFVPAVVGGVIFYAYSSGGWVGGFVRSAIDPVVLPVMRFFTSVFSGVA